MVKVIKSESKSGTVEKFKGGFGKMSETSKGKLKRNLIIAAAIVLIAGAICLNFVLFADKSSSQVYEPSGVTTQAPGQNTDSTPEEPESYFAMAQQNRASAYETAYNTLLAVTTSSTATASGMKHCFFKKVKYPRTPVPWKPLVSTAQPPYTAHSSSTKK